MESKSKIDQETAALYENAHRRIKQKKRLATHAVIFVAGSVILIVVNVVLGYKSDFQPFNTDWFVTAIVIWLFFLIIHAINVFVVNKLMGKEWEEKQMHKLVEKQLSRISKLQGKVDKKHPISNEETQNETQKTDKDS
ncbi:2TM domain-containing protein [Psychroflexus aestuariivivens]|uniref:2TM domain-containing protein n=1 Tax=Psychroflexus aestuariivivens TaxID=1795040 RepID=UPI000FD9CAEC|nr:2TM domain-containing protein [Psychroflexus aestuariivivens]